MNISRIGIFNINSPQIDQKILCNPSRIIFGEFDKLVSKFKWKFSGPGITKMNMKRVKLKDLHNPFSRL